VNERNDHLSGLAQVLDRRVAPRSEFADALLERLLAELEPPAVAPGPRRPWASRLRSPKLALALFLGLAAVVVAGVVVTGPQRASALDVIRQARAAFAHMPPFQATYQVALNPGGGEAAFKAQGVPKGATATVVVSYGGPDRFRTQILAEHLISLTHTGTPRPGSYQVFNGRTSASYNSLWKRFDSSPSSAVPALENLSWHGAYPDWERICRGPHSNVLADAHIAGRDARHIRCTDFTGNTWELWIDRQTGLLLKIVGQVGADDFFLGGGIGTSAKGGFEIEKLRYNPAFPAATFSVKAPPGAFDFQARVRAALAKVPPFRAVFYLRGPNGSSFKEEVWRLNSQTWREKTLAGTGGQASNVGNFSVSGPGGQVIYDAQDKTYSRSAYSADSDPAQQLLPADKIYSFSHAECAIVGHDRVIGRDAVHRHCPATRSPVGVPVPSADIWADSATGLVLEYDTFGPKKYGGGAETRVLSIVYRPSFPPGTFRFVPPPGSASEQPPSQLEQSPYYKTKLAPGKPAPNWHATTLSGKRFQITDLRGKPALLLLLADWCSDPACDELAALEEAYQKSDHGTQVVWVDFQGAPGRTKKIARLNHVTFPVVYDAHGAMTKAWAIPGVPYFLLLDSRGRVIEAHFHQTAAQITRMLAEPQVPR
jgi:outer membrane lipoprotein-sorting protein